MKNPAILFDLDGLLVDSEPKWSIVESSFYERAGLPFDASTKLRLVGRTLEGVVATIAADTRHGDEGELQEEFLSKLEALLSGVDILPGVQSSVHWALNNFDCAVVTNSPRRLAESSFAALDRAGILPDIQITFDDVTRGKPAPDGYILAAHRLDRIPSLTIAVEDSHTGIVAARAAGSKIVGISGDASIAQSVDFYSEMMTVELLQAAAGTLSQG